MCPYMKYNERQEAICEPKKDLCLYCVLGNAKRYNEIEAEENKKC